MKKQFALGVVGAILLALAFFQYLSFPIRKSRNAPAWQACFAVSENSERADVRNATNRNDALQDRSTGDRRGWRPSRRKPQGLLYFSIDYFVINASLPR